MKTRRVFKLTDLKSGDGMMTSIWGPCLWHFLHTLSFNYPIEPTKAQMNTHRAFVLNLEHILPCKYCRVNLKKNFKALPLTLECMKNRDTFSRYIYQLHEHINKMLGKKSNLSYCDVRERYEHFRARCTLNEPSKEKGCTEPLIGKKSKCVLHIIPKEVQCESIQIDQTCLKQKI